MLTQTIQGASILMSKAGATSVATARRVKHDLSRIAETQIYSSCVGLAWHDRDGRRRTWDITNVLRCPRMRTGRG